MWTLDDMQFVYDNYRLLTDKEIADYLGKTEQSVYCKRYKTGLIKGSRKWTKEEDLYLLKSYKNTSSREIATKFQRSKAAINHRAKKLGIKKDTYTINHSFFSIIDSELKAYFLGLMWADGFVGKYKSYYRTGIALQEQDGYVIEQFNEALGSNYPVNYRNRPDRPYKMVSLHFGSRQIFHDLCKLGIIPRKSKKDTPFPVPPKLDESLVPHFVRGLFDGDGCITLVKRNNWSPNPRVSIANGLPTCEWLLAKTQSLLGIGGNVYFKDYSTWYLWGRKQVATFSDWLYNDATIYLTRKRETFQKIGLLGGVSSL